MTAILVYKVKVMTCRKVIYRIFTFFHESLDVISCWDYKTYSTMGYYTFLERPEPQLSKNVWWPSGQSIYLSHWAISVGKSRKFYEHEKRRHLYYSTSNHARATNKTCILTFRTCKIQIRQLFWSPRSRSWPLARSFTEFFSWIFC